MSFAGLNAQRRRCFPCSYFVSTRRHRQILCPPGPIGQPSRLFSIWSRRPRTGPTPTSCRRKPESQHSIRMAPPGSNIRSKRRSSTVQIVYCLERVPALVKAKPELKNVEPFKMVLSGNREAIAKLPTKELLKILAPPQTCEGRSPGNKGKRQGRPWRDWPYCNVRNFASWNRLCNRADTDVNDWDVTDRWGPDDGTWE